MDFDSNILLIEQLKQGEEKAYVFLLETYHRRLHAYALTLVDDYAMAQDIVQNVFMNTWRFRKKLDAKFSIQSFLYKSVYNEFINTYQKKQSMMLLHQKYLESLNDVVESFDQATLEKMIVRVTKAIQELPPKCQKVFTLSKKEGLTNIEISEYLDVSVKAVEAQITKAFSILRKKLGDKIEITFFFLFGMNINEN